MKRSAELRDLSEQHHYGLISARNLRLAAEGRRPLRVTVREFLQEWEAEILPHFRAEEEVLLPGCARALADDHPLLVRTLVEHVALRHLARELAAAEAGDDARLAELAAETGSRFHDLIRFEERELFPAVEQACAGPLLQELGGALERVVTLRTSCRLGGNLKGPAESLRS